MRKLRFILMLLLLALTPAVLLDAKEEDYRKFLESKDLQVDSSFLNIFRKGDEIYLEVPDSLLGRRVLLSSVLRRSSEPDFPEGTDLSDGSAYRLARTDSLLLFLRPAAPFVVKDGEPSIVKAMEGARTDAVDLAVPILYRKPGGGSVIVKADQLLSASRKSVINLKNKSYGEYRINTATQKTDLSSLRGITAYPGSVGVRREVTFELKLTGLIGFELAGNYSFTGEVETCLTLMPERTAVPVKADGRIGVQTVTCPTIDPAGGIRDEKWVSRWNLGAIGTVKVYVDTLLASPWYEAVRDGILEWNRAFVASGLGEVLEVAPYPACPDFHSDDPLVNTVTVGNALSVSVNRDPQTGEILSSKLVVPLDFVAQARREGMVFISDVDPRFRRYDVPQDAVAEVLKCRVTSLFARSLGLAPNYAGSYAYSPAQLRDPAFTQEHGITASVSDDVVFNLLALPGDRERGVVTVSDRLGAYDYYAIRWIYDDSLDRDAWISSHGGQAEYLYLPQSRINADPRALAGDLGNDPFETFDTVVARLKWVTVESPAWLEGDEVGSSYKDLFADYVWLGLDRVTRVLSAQVGGLMTGDCHAGSDAPKFTPVPADLQKRAIDKMLGEWLNMYWMDTDRTLLLMAGANNNASTFTRMFSWSQSRLPSRLQMLAMSEQVGSEYTLDRALADIEEVLTANLRSGKPLSPGEEQVFQNYIATLSGMSPVLQANAARATHSSSLQISSVPASYRAGIEASCYAALTRLHDTVSRALPRYRGQEKGRVAYILSKIDNALEGNS